MTLETGTSLPFSVQVAGICIAKHFYFWIPNSTFANSDDPDEMPHNAAFHQRLHCLFKYSFREIAFMQI